MNLYITADKIGTPTGGGVVTYNECGALERLGEVKVIDKSVIGEHPDPFILDQRVVSTLGDVSLYKIAHIYAGGFPKTVRKLREYGVRVTYTAAAHDIQLSKEEHKSLGVGYDYPHINDKKLFEQYLDGYVSADQIVCPSNNSAKIMKQFGCSRIKVIPHGVVLPEKVTKLPNIFRVGYLGQPGPDKGLQYLFKAWKKLNLIDASLVLAGSNITNTLPWVREFGGGNIEYLGYVESPSDLYNYISVYCQPSVTEGFGIEILEAMAHRRPVIAAVGAGAHDLIGDGGLTIPIRDIDTIARSIYDFYKNRNLESIGECGRKIAETLTWPSIRNQYVEMWGSLR